MNVILPLILASLASGRRLHSSVFRTFEEGAHEDLKAIDVVSAFRSPARQEPLSKRQSQASISVGQLRMFLLAFSHPMVLRRLNCHSLGSHVKPLGAQMTGVAPNSQTLKIVPATPADNLPSELSVSPAEAGVTTSEKGVWNFQEVIGILNTDIPMLLKQQPTWAIYAENLKLTDQTGARIEGLGAIKYLLRLVRTILSKRLNVQDIQFSIKPPSQQEEDAFQFLVSRWKFRIGRNERQFIVVGKKDEPLDFEAEVFVYFNAQGQIDHLRLKRWLVNGKSLPVQLKLWPDIEICNGKAAIKKKLKDWYAAADGLEPLNGTAFETIRDTLVPTRREFVTTSAIQVGILLVGKGEIERISRRSRGDFDAVDSLREDIPFILTEEPDWSYFDEDFTLIDQVGVTVKGLGPNKRLLKVLRNLRDGLFLTPLRAEFDARTEKLFLDNEDGTRSPVVVAYWNLNIDIRSRIPYDIMTSIESQTLANLKVSTFPIRFAGKSCFQFTNEGKVRQMSIDEWSIDGKQVQIPLLNLRLPFGTLFAGGDNERLEFRRKVRELEARLAEVEAKTDADTVPSTEVESTEAITETATGLAIE